MDSSYNVALPQVIRVDDKALKVRSIRDSQAQNLAHASTLRAMNHAHLTDILDVVLYENNFHRWMRWNGVETCTITSWLTIAFAAEAYFTRFTLTFEPPFNTIYMHTTLRKSTSLL